MLSFFRQAGVVWLFFSHLGANAEVNVSAQVLQFTRLATQDESDIPTPLYFQTGDEYVRLNVSTDELTETLFRPGAVAVFLRGFHVDGALHLLILNGEPAVSRVFRSRRGNLRAGASLDDSQTVPASDVIGAVAEIYPLGLSGPRHVIYRADRAHLLASVNHERGMDYPLALAR